MNDLEHVDPGPLCRDCYRPIGEDGDRKAFRCAACDTLHCAEAEAYSHRETEWEAEQYLRDAAAADTHSSDVDPGDR